MSRVARVLRSRPSVLGVAGLVPSQVRLVEQYLPGVSFCARLPIWLLCSLFGRRVARGGRGALLPGCLDPALPEVASLVHLKAHAIRSLVEETLQAVVPEAGPVPIQSSPSASAFSPASLHPRAAPPRNPRFGDSVASVRLGHVETATIPWSSARHVEILARDAARTGSHQASRHHLRCGALPPFKPRVPGSLYTDLAAGGSRTSSIGMQERDSDENTMDDFYVSDDEFHVPFLPVLSPRCVTISRRFILDLALKKLGLTIEDTKVTDAGDGELYASISLHLSADKGRRPLEPTVFHGDFAGTKEKSIESASSAALAFLKDKSMIYVDDANYHELKACQHKLLAASSWAMLFEDRAAVLKRQMSKLSGEARNVEKEIDVSSDSRDTNDTCPLALVDMKDTSSQQSTPPPKLDSASKRTGKQVVCATRRVLFGKRKCNQAA